ncbi:predicted protein [Micromonas commoda]|uniref:Uncharacterized protein n=1 Tax=Micromonas commoda (strain RCC299 / NOUM17 / CCMP2709) TaxID=296587 RepID=C1EI04_MICCC|nr:predicted protein [Micromonas commoda]ACO67773.1 predicted protein [Micromonas commoda]|eukprot:XP_002506515.1 predicted protein [Micromonas commoda]
MSARATLLNFAKRAAKAPVRVTRRNMSGGGTIEEERAHMEKWRGVTFLAVPGCIGLGVYLFSNHHEHHAHEQPAYSYMRRRLKQLPWGGDCALFEYGKCQEN